MKVVINSCFGGFSLSEKAMNRLIELASGELKKKLVERKKRRDQSKRGITGYYPDIPRNHPLLIKVVEELGDKASGRFACLEVVEIPDDVEWQIEEYDGSEWIAEKHRTWGRY